MNFKKLIIFTILITNQTCLGVKTTAELSHAEAHDAYERLTNLFEICAYISAYIGAASDMKERDEYLINKYGTSNTDTIWILQIKELSKIYDEDIASFSENKLFDWFEIKKRELKRHLKIRAPK